MQLTYTICACKFIYKQNLSRKGETLGFLEPSDIDINEITTKTVPETVLQNDDYSLASYTIYDPP